MDVPTRGKSRIVKEGERGCGFVAKPQKKDLHMQIRNAQTYETVAQLKKLFVPWSVFLENASSRGTKVKDLAKGRGKIGRGGRGS